MIYTTAVSFPNIFSTATGKTKLNATFEAINTRLSVLIQTAYTELFGNPDFGCGIYEATFDYASEDSFDALADNLSEAIERFEPTLTVSSDMIEIKFNQQTHHIEITINYILKNTNFSSSTTLDLGVSE